MRKDPQDSRDGQPNQGRSKQQRLQSSRPKPERRPDHLSGEVDAKDEFSIP
jgi:hypothetical protein